MTGFTPNTLNMNADALRIRIALKNETWDEQELKKLSKFEMALKQLLVEWQSGNEEKFKFTTNVQILNFPSPTPNINTNK